MEVDLVAHRKPPRDPKRKTLIASSLPLHLVQRCDWDFAGVARARPDAMNRKAWAAAAVATIHSTELGAFALLNVLNPNIAVRDFLSAVRAVQLKGGGVLAGAVIDADGWAARSGVFVAPLAHARHHWP